MEGFKRSLILVMLFGLFLASAMQLFSVGVAEAMSTHNTILIDGNANFTPVNGVTFGSGTENNPYIIEGWDINASTANGIEIRNTTAYFVIRNCYIHDGRENYDGVHFRDVSNGTIENVNFTNDLHGIYLGSSPNNLIRNCTASNNSFGIYSWVSENNTLRNNALSNNWRNIGFHGTQPSHFYQDIDNSNTVEGRPIYYLVERENLTIDGNVMDIGYLGLVSCKNILVKNLNIRNNINAVLLANTTYSTVKNCTLTNSSYGVHLNNSSNNIIENCVTLNNSHGIYLHFSSNNNIVRNCTASGNTSYGIIFYLYSDNNHAYHNNILNNINQARDEGTNYWDDGYLSGGNYWSDYRGVDEKYGENQNISGRDGIGDTPYQIPGGVRQDRYPLMSQDVAELEVSSLRIEPSVVEPSKPVTISVDVKNRGDSETTYWVKLKINGAVESIENVTLAGGETRSVAFTVIKVAEGNYEIEVDGIGGTFMVEAHVNPSLNWPLIIGLISLAIAIIGIAVALYIRKGAAVEKPSFQV
jgi:parallel beta-helix repeat protein